MIGDALLDWRGDPALAVALALAACAYLWAALRARRWSRWRTLSFLAGLAVLALALGTGLAAGDGRHLSLHMVEHLLIVVAAPPLLLLGAPLRLALLALPQRHAAATARALRSRPVRALFHPAGAWAVFTLVLVASHAPPLYEAALRSGPLHALQHSLYFWSALALWQSALAVPPVPAPSPIGRMLLLMAAAPAMILIGATLTGAADVVYGHYAAATGDARALADQRDSGTIMWLGGSLPMAAALVVVGWAAVRREEAQAVARERSGAGGGSSAEGRTASA